jgi:hypothetical protein
LVIQHARTVVALTTSFTPIAAKPRDSRLGYSVTLMFVVLDGDEEVLFATAVAIAASMCGVASGAMLLERLGTSGVHH